MAKKKMFVGILALVLLFGLASCAASPAMSLFSGPHPSFSNVNGISAKTGTASSTVFLGMGSTTYPTLSDAAKNGGITKIATVEYYKKVIFPNIAVQYTTIVTGE
jgi:hypothetical protein